MQLALLGLLLVVGAEPQATSWQIDGTKREDLVYAPSAPGEAPPLIFVFHGHGGQMRGVAKNFRIQEVWPEAVVVYPQGLLTPSRYDPEGKRPGWQRLPGEQQDRDLKLFDAMLAAMKEKYHIDASRVYATGHSNGGAFTYLLLAVRPQVLAAVALSAAGGMRLDFPQPLPVLHLAGRADKVAPFAGQQTTMEQIRQLDHCAAEGQTWADNCLLYPSTSNTPFVSFIHEGGHEFRPEAPALIARFFKEYARPVATSDSAAGK